MSAFDTEKTEGKDIIIEERDAAEVTTFAGRQIAPEGIEVLNLAFDVTPGRNITAIFTGQGIMMRPTKKA